MRITLWMFLGLLLMFPTTIRANEGDLILQAHGILRQHCAKCHHDGEGGYGGFNVLDHADLTQQENGIPAIVTGGAASDRSLLVQFVEDGTMPPGSHPKLSSAEVEIIKQWAKQGARRFPPQFDDHYVLEEIRRDFDEQAAAVQPFLRYVSLHAPIQQARVAGHSFDSLETYRANLLTAINALTEQRLPSLHWVDPAQTIARLNLQDLGWDKPLFREKQDEDLYVGEPRFNLWDVLLLEYPFGYQVPNTPAYTTEQIRPVAFIRGDWLAHHFNDPKMFDELRLLRGMPNATIAIGDDPPEPAKTTIPEEFTFIPPIDARNLEKFDGKSAGFTVNEFGVLNMDKNPPQLQEQFDVDPPPHVGFRIRADKAAHFELIWVADLTDSLPLTLTKETKRVAKNEVRDLKGAGDGYEHSGEVGQETVTVFMSQSPDHLGGKLFEQIDPPPDHDPIQRFIHLNPKTDFLVRRSVELTFGKFD